MVPLHFLRFLGAAQVRTTCSSHNRFLRLVESIEVYFLPVGHTHGQIDQLFSRLSFFLKRMPAKTLPELCWSLYQAYNQPSKPRRVPRNPRKNQAPMKERVPVRASVVDSVVDVVHWSHQIHPNVTKVFARKKNTFKLKDTHAFRMWLEPDGDVHIASKTYAVDPEWKVVNFSF